MHRFKKALSLILVMCFMSAFVSQGAYAVPYSSLTNDSIKEKEGKVSESKKQKEALQASITNAKEKKKELEAYKNDISQYIEKLDGDLAEIQNHIDELNGLITTKEAEIEVATEELNEAIETEETQYQAMKDRIRFMYEKGDSFYLEIMLNAQTFGDFLTKAGYIDKLEAYDRKMLDEYQATREWTQLCKDDLEAQKETLDEAKKVAEAEEANLNEMLMEKEAELSNYNTRIAQQSAEIANSEAELAAEIAVIEALEAQILEEKKQLAAQQNRITYDGGMFAWPCPGYIRITEEFGWRTNPFSGRSEFHSGLDMGAPAGTAILAAYDGVVVASAYNWSMGNYIMIDHGDGLYTIYMHASKLYANSGDIVVKGETIAAVGTTGSSTGNHLHFGVRLNGQYVSPWNYFN